MNIAVVIESYQPFGGGNERSTAQIVDRLASSGHQVTVLTNRGPTPPSPGSKDGTNHKIVAANGPKTSSAMGFKRFTRWAENQLAVGEFDTSISMTLAVAADVVQPRGGTAKETLARNIAMRRTPLARSFKQIGIALNPKQRALLAAEKRTLQSTRTKRIIAISQYVYDQLRVHYNVPDKNIVMIPNAAAITPMSDEARQIVRQKVRTTYNIKDTDVAMLFAAVNPKLKGLDPLLLALANVKQTGHTPILLVAGTMAYRYQRLADELDVRDQLRWIGPTRQIDSLYTATDVTVHPTYYDPSSKVVLESLLHGVPAISTAYNGASQWIVDPTGQSSWSSSLVNQQIETDSVIQPAGRVIDSPDNIPALTSAIIALCDSDERERCIAATHLVDPVLDMDRHAVCVESVLAQVASVD